MRNSRLRRSYSDNYLVRRSAHPPEGFCSIGKFGEVSYRIKKCASRRTLVPKRGCGSSHFPYARSAHPPEGFCSIGKFGEVSYRTKKEAEIGENIRFRPLFICHRRMFPRISRSRLRPHVSQESSFYQLCCSAIYLPHIRSPILRWYLQNALRTFLHHGRTGLPALPHRQPLPRW